ncbi:hypothetical protein MTP99_015397 [Tenebrio molitor]|jgi:hypothetical protein|nr:hypothetical protein MTP99_015397 [Tenebrio molitor]
MKYETIIPNGRLPVSRQVSQSLSDSIIDGSVVVAWSPFSCQRDVGAAIRSFSTSLARSTRGDIYKGRSGVRILPSDCDPEPTQNEYKTKEKENERTTAA